MALEQGTVSLLYQLKRLTYKSSVGSVVREAILVRLLYRVRVPHQRHLMEAFLQARLCQPLNLRSICQA